MKLKLTFTLLISLLIGANISSQDVSSDKKNSNYIFSTWVHGESHFDSIKWNTKLDAYLDLGITEILSGGSVEFLDKLVKMAGPKNIKVHAWMWTLNRPNDTIANKHPEWYAVNRKGQNSLEYRAYVDYYQWLSPFHPDARAHVIKNVKKLMQVKGLASIHLDYVRYADVILGADLQPKYGLVQVTEMPEYDYGYHPVARAGFKKIFGKDPMEMSHPELSTEWRQYRLNAISSLVNEIVNLAHSEGQKITAAVFPFPEMSRQMVRQAWNDWNLDGAYPMLYNNFYREGINWIGFCTEQCVRDVKFPVFAGLYAPALRNPDDFERAIKLSIKNGASGVAIFTADGLSPAQRESLKAISDSIAKEAFHKKNAAN